jgi:alkylation response protein AidB-like acyl-CoA dehydrogenase
VTVDFELTEEQRWLAESVDALLLRQAGDDGLVAADSGDRLWLDLVAFGALDVDPTEDTLGAVDLALVARAVGERLAAVPLVATATLRYLAAQDALEGSGLAAALCLSEPDRSFAPSAPATTLDGHQAFGEKSAVLFAEQVDVLALSAATGDGPALALVDARSPAVTLTPEPILDPSLRAGRVRLDGAAARPLPADHPAAFLERVAATAAVLTAAEAVGAAVGVLELARAYASQRRQFGRTIGSFQAVRHLLADMVVKVESSWSSVLYAAASLDEEDADDLRTASIAKAWTSLATLDVAHGALQVFGGIAFTAEHPAHRFLRRIASLGDQYGTTSDHERRLGRALARELEVIT